MATIPLPQPPTIPVLGWRAHALRLFSDSARFPRERQRCYGNLVNLGAGKGGGLLVFGPTVLDVGPRLTLA